MRLLDEKEKRVQYLPIAPPVFCDVPTCKNNTESTIQIIVTCPVVFFHTPPISILYKENKLHAKNVRHLRLNFSVELK